MSSPEHKPVPLNAEMEKQRAELASIVHRHTWEDGSYGTAITSLYLSRHNTPLGVGHGPVVAVHATVLGNVIAVVVGFGVDQQCFEFGRAFGFKVH